MGSYAVGLWQTPFPWWATHALTTCWKARWTQHGSSLPSPVDCLLTTTRQVSLHLGARVPLSIAGLEALWGDDPLLTVLLLRVTCTFACYGCAEIAVKMAEISAALRVNVHSATYCFCKQTPVKEAISLATAHSYLGIHIQCFPGHGTPTANKNDAKGNCNGIVKVLVSPFYWQFCSQSQIACALAKLR